MATKKKICRKCKLVYEGEKCPICGMDIAATTGLGRIYVFDANKSEVAKIAAFKQKGEYAIKVR